MGPAAAARHDPRPHCQRHAAVSAAVALTVSTGEAYRDSVLVFSDPNKNNYDPDPAQNFANSVKDPDSTLT